MRLRGVGALAALVELLHRQAALRGGAPEAGDRGLALGVGGAQVRHPPCASTRGRCGGASPATTAGSRRRGGAPQRGGTGPAQQQARRAERLARPAVEAERVGVLGDQPVGEAERRAHVVDHGAAGLREDIVGAPARAARVRARATRRAARAPGTSASATSRRARSRAGREDGVEVRVRCVARGHRVAVAPVERGVEPLDQRRSSLIGVEDAKLAGTGPPIQERGAPWVGTRATRRRARSTSGACPTATTSPRTSATSTIPTSSR